MFNLGTAAGTGAAGLALESPLCAVGPAGLGTAIAALTIIPTTAAALRALQRTGCDLADTTDATTAARAAAPA